MSINYGYQPIVTNGLVLHLDAANPNSYRSGSTAWNDLSGNRNNGTLINGPGYDSANFGSITFDGVNDYTSIDNSIPNFISSTATVSSWVYLKNAFDSNTIAIANSIFSIYADDYNRGLIYFSSDTSYKGTIGSLMVDNGVVSGRVYTQQNSWSQGWYNVVAVRALSNYKIYVNGVDMALTIVSNTATKAFPTSSIYTLLAGSYYSIFGLYAFFTGSISTAQIYNRALSATEVQQNYNAQKSRYGL